MGHFDGYKTWVVDYEFQGHTFSVDIPARSHVEAAARLAALAQGATIMGYIKEVAPTSRLIGQESATEVRHFEQAADGTHFVREGFTCGRGCPDCPEETDCPDDGDGEDEVARKFARAVLDYLKADAEYIRSMREIMSAGRED